VKQEEGFAAVAQAGLVLHKVSDAIGALQLRWISLHEKDSINAEAFLTVRTSGSKAWHELYGEPQSSSARAVREAYIEPFDFPLCHHFPVQIVQPAASREFLNTSNHFHALEWPLFVPISYTYVPTAPRSKSTGTRDEPAPKQFSILDRLQRSKLSEAALSMARLAAADDSGGDKLGIRGKL